MATSDDCQIYISAEDIGIHTIVSTSKKQVETCLECVISFADDHKKRLYKDLFTKLISINYHKLCAMVDDGDTEARMVWQTCCEDIVMLFCLRFVMFKKPIPILSPDSLDELRRGMEYPVPPE